jgi:hypothetical protein
VIADYMMNHVYNDFTDIDSQQEQDPKIAETKTKSPSMKQRFHEIMDDISEEKNIQKRRQAWRSWSKQNGGEGDFPLMFPEMLGLPKTVRNADGMYKSNDYHGTR